MGLASLAILTIGEDVLFPYMNGLPYEEYDEAIKLGLTGTRRLEMPQSR